MIESNENWSAFTKKEVSRTHAYAFVFAISHKLPKIAANGRRSQPIPESPVSACYWQSSTKRGYYDIVSVAVLGQY